MQNKDENKDLDILAITLIIASKQDHSFFLLILQTVHPSSIQMLCEYYHDALQKAQHKQDFIACYKKSGFFQTPSHEESKLFTSQEYKI